MVKAIVVILILVGIGLLVAYQWGGVGGFDPTEQGRRAKAAVSPGMTWQQVADAAGEPRKYNIFGVVKRNRITQIVVVNTADYDPGNLARDIAAGSLPHGFAFPYNFSAQAAFRVVFDAKGVAVEIEDLQTVADLLDTRGDG